MTNLSGRVSRPNRSAMSTPIWPRSTRPKVGSTYSSPSIARPSSPTPSRVTKRLGGLRATYSAVSSRLCPTRVHTVLTENGTHFLTPGNVASAASIIKEAIAAGEIFRAHTFDLACDRNDIEHRLTKPRHPWTNGQVERMNRTITDATVKRDHDGSHALTWPTSSAPTASYAA